MADYEKTTSPNIVVDKSSGVLINTDIGAYTAIKKAREEKRRNADVADRVTRLEQQVAELKELLGK